MSTQLTHQFSLALTFATNASRYWLYVFPTVVREVRRWRHAARRIPAWLLRQLALLTHDSERGNLEGAAAFAVLAPRRNRAAVVRAVVAFQSLYDYVDTLAEQPGERGARNGRRLHLALLAALDERRPLRRYHGVGQPSSNGDDGYLHEMIDACREACAELPSYQAARIPALRAAARMISYQALIHDGVASTVAMRHWASSATPPASGLYWWETAAGAASSLGVFALIAAAATPGRSEQEMCAIEGAYFPWVGALHVLLDSLVDRAADDRSGHLSLVSEYADAEHAALRLARITELSLSSIEALPDERGHATIFAAMTSFYLSDPAADTPECRRARAGILRRIGALAAPMMAILETRRAVGGWVCRLSDLKPRLPSPGPG